MSIRHIYLNKRNTISLEEQQHASTHVCQHILTLDQYQHAQSIALYFSINNEIDLHELWSHSETLGKHCYFPVINDDRTLSFLPATLQTPFKTNRYGISEPNVNHHYALSPEQLDIIFVPMVAFDTQGHRLGMGGGYYDRTLAFQKPTLLAGVAYDFQQQALIDTKPWDVSMGVIITPTTLYWP